MQKPVSDFSSLREKVGSLGVIFDLDGTMIDTAGDLAAAMNHILALHDIGPLSTDKVRHLVGHGARAMIASGFEQAAGRTIDDETLREMGVEFVDYYAANIAVHSKPFPGFVDLLEQLKTAQIRLAVCTNKRESLARTLLDALGLTEYFDVIVGGDTAGVAKPDPAPVKLCLKAMDIPVRKAPGRVIFVGDSDTDVKAAKAVKLPVTICRFGYGPLRLIEQADAVIAHYGMSLDSFLAPLLVNADMLKQQPSKNQQN